VSERKKSPLDDIFNPRRKQCALMPSGFGLAPGAVVMFRRTPDGAECHMASGTTAHMAMDGDGFRIFAATWLMAEMGLTPTEAADEVIRVLGESDE